MSEETGRFCSVCQTRASEDDSESHWEELPCKHEFHSKCIIQSLLHKPECPLCRFRVQPSNEPISFQNHLGGLHIYFTELDDLFPETASQVGRWLQEAEEQEERSRILQEAQRSEWWNQLTQEFRNWNEHVGHLQTEQERINQLVNRRVRHMRNHLRNQRTRVQRRMRENRGIIGIRNSHESRRRILGQVEQFLENRVPNWISRESMRIMINGLLQQSTGIAEQQSFSFWSTRHFPSPDDVTNIVIDNATNMNVPAVELNEEEESTNESESESDGESESESEN